MSKCEVCEVECAGKTCSGSCRAKLSRQGARSEAHAHKRTVKAHAPIPTTFTDVTGNVHDIDYEGRRNDHNLLKSWAEGQGNDWQYNLGRRAMDGYLYRGFTRQHEIDRYLGVDSTSMTSLQPHHSHN